MLGIGTCRLIVSFSLVQCWGCRGVDDQIEVIADPTINFIRAGSTGGPLSCRTADMVCGGSIICSII
eukprot:1602000-Amphidinium_carterae.1